MQIQSIKKEELALLITGLRAIHVGDQVELKQRLEVQLETELATRFGVMVGTANDQARNTVVA